MHFANPIWLWALSGLLIPIGIHLFSRKEGNVIPLGSIRHLRETPTARYRNIRLNELALLFLRCILIALMACLLAGAELAWSPDETRKWLLIEPGLENASDVNDIVKQARAQGFEVRSLSDYFPPVSGHTKTLEASSYWSALRDLVLRDLDSAVIISYSYERNFRGERLALPSNINWISYPPVQKEFVAQAFSISADSVMLRKGKTSAYMTQYETLTAPSREVPDSVHVTAPEVLQITIFADDEFQYDERVLRACLQAIQSVTPHRLSMTIKKTEEAQESATGISFWLADRPPPGSIGRLTIGYHACKQKKLPLLIASSHAIPGCQAPKNVSWILTQRLTEESVLRGHFTLSLAQLILPTAGSDKVDERVLPEAMKWSSGKDVKVKENMKQESAHTELLIFLFFLVVLLTERAVAYKRNQ